MRGARLIVSRLPVRWYAVAALVALGVGAAAYAMRPVLVAVLRAPYPCNLGSGCVDVPPWFATAFMLSFDAALVWLAFWQFRGGRLHVAADRTGDAKRPWRAALALIAIAGLAGRFLLPELKQFGWDETHMSWLAVDAMLNGHLPLTGIQSSVQIPNPAGAIYLLAPGLLPFLNGPGAAEAAISFGGLASAVTTLLCAWFTLRWTGSSSASLAAGAAFALGFWPLFQGRRVWQQLFLPPFTVLFFDALLLLALRKRSPALIWASGWLALLVQFHYVSATLLPLLLAAAWLGKSSLNVRSVLASVALAAALLAPFALWEVSFDNAFVDVREALAYSQRPASVDTKSVQFALNLGGAGLSDEQYQLYLGYGRYENWQVRLYQRTVAGLAELPVRMASAGTLLFVLGLVTCVFLVVRSGDRNLRITYGFLTAWVLLSVLVLVRHSLEIAQHYFFHLIPAIAVLIGMGVHWPRLIMAHRLPVIAPLWQFLGPTLLVTYLAGSVILLTLILSIAQRIRLDHYQEPVGILSSVGRAVHQAWLSSGRELPIMVGAQARDRERILLAAGASTPHVGFDDCVELTAPPQRQGKSVYVLRDFTPTAEYLLNSSAAELVATIERPHASPYRVFLVEASEFSPQRWPDRVRSTWLDCRERY